MEFDELSNRVIKCALRAHQEFLRALRALRGETNRECEQDCDDEGKLLYQIALVEKSAAIAAPSNKKEIVNVLQLVASLKAHDVVDEIIAFLSPDKEPEFLTATYGPAVVTALEQLKGRDYDRVIMKKYVEHIRQWVQIDFPSPPNRPKDWFREGSLKCNCKLFDDAQDLVKALGDLTGDNL